MNERGDRLKDFTDHILKKYSSLNAREALQSMMNKRSIELYDLSITIKEILNWVLNNQDQVKSDIETSLK